VRTVAPDVLIAVGLTRWFESGHSRVHAVRGASLRVGEAEVVAVLGRSGAGTSALLSICGGIDRPDQGRVFVAGRDLAEMDGPDREGFLRRTVGWMLQRPALLPLLSVEENVAVVLRIAGVPEQEAARAARTALEAVGLLGRAAHRGSDLSAAEQRCAALARALVKAPALLVADQPTAHLDARAASTVLGLLRAAADSGTPVLFATHDEGAAAAADRVLVMDAGALSER
jgi:putative ABC transport system ATP-binding protein